MKVRLFRQNDEGKREFQGYFTAQDGRVVFYAWRGAGLECLPQSNKEAEQWQSNGESPLTDSEFIASFGRNYRAQVPEEDRSIHCSMYEPEDYLRHLKYRYRDNPWVEVSADQDRRCPRCDSYKIVIIRWGFQPKPEVTESDDWRDTMVLGGCLMSGNDPRWACTDCGQWFWDTDQC